MKRRHNPPTMQTVQRVDGSTYQTLDTHRLRNASPLQTVLPARRRLGIVSIILVAVIVVLLALALSVSKGAGSARAQEIGEPWCEIGAPPQPQLVEGKCISPRAYLPMVNQ